MRCSQQPSPNRARFRGPKNRRCRATFRTQSRQRQPTGPPVEVGYVKLTDPHFLVRYVPDSADWFRLPARSRLMSGDRLIVFPTYRPEIVLTPGVQVVLAGPSSVQTRPNNAQGEPELAMDYGRR